MPVINSLYLYPFILAAALSLVLVYTFARGIFGSVGLDVPNERSLHKKPVPRLGGLGILVSANFAWLVQMPGSLGYFVLLLSLLSAVCLVDDLAGLPVSTRLVVQVLAALIFLHLYLMTSWVLVPVAMLVLIWTSNLYNFMDGSDGLAGGMTLIGFGIYGIAADAGGHKDIAMLALAISGAGLGFLVWNFPKAIIFMGDSGSIPLGFAAGAMGMLGWERGAWPIWFPILVFSPFIADATVTLLQRWRRGEKLTQAHKAHYYQRALQIGLGHRGTALSGYALMLLSGVAALIARLYSGLFVAILLALVALIYFVIFQVIDRFWLRRFTQNS